MKDIANRVPIGPSDCNRGMYVWPSTVGPKPNERRSKGRLQQNNAYNPFSEKSKKMIQDMGHVELVELFETAPKTQCNECLSYWSEGIVYCTCWHLLKESEASRGAMSTSLRRDDPMATDMGKNSTTKRMSSCIKKHFKGIHDRFLKDSEFRASQLEHDRDEEVCIKIDDLADKDFSHYMTGSDHFRYKQNWWISLNKSGNTGPLRNRSHFNQALSTLNLLHPESGERPLRTAALLEVPGTAPIIEFFLQLVAMEWILWSS